MPVRGVYLSMGIRMLCRAAIRYSQEAEGSDALNDDTFGDVARPAVAQGVQDKGC